MKKYVSCFLFFFCLTSACLVGLFYVTGREEESREAMEVQMTESVDRPVFAGSEAESRPAEYNLVLNQGKVDSVYKESEAETEAENYCLVAEEGYLIVYNRDLVTVNMFTHMPLVDFPVEEQEKLMEGIWFPTMAEIFSYMESYTS